MQEWIIWLAVKDDGFVAEKRMEIVPGAALLVSAVEELEIDACVNEWCW